MQNAAFAVRGLDWADVALDVPPERLAEAVSRFAAPGLGRTLVDLPYPRSATADAAARAGARVLDGLEVLVAQGAASFELWTGFPAPVPVMRRALGLPA